jgi:dTDP-glucose pyrophosphorylase
MAAASSSAVIDRQAGSDAGRLEACCLSGASTIGEVMAQIERNAAGIVLLVDARGRLETTITDGDIRRALLSGKRFEDQARDILPAKAGLPGPFFAREGQGPKYMAELMRANGIRHLPVLDEDGRVVDLVFLERLIPEARVELSALIMAGGFGKRLRPLTNCLPKPMLPVGGRPLLEFIVDRLRLAGITKIFISTHYLSEHIVEHFGHGGKFGVELQYLKESKPLGTAGALGLMPPSDVPLLVINGDVLTEVDFRAMLSFHLEHEAALTMAVKEYTMQVPYGVVETGGPRVRQLWEKPSYSFLTNAGIYILDPSVLGCIERNQRIDMPDLIKRLIREDRMVSSFPLVEYWLDIGQHAEYEQAQRDRPEAMA